jgi:hypothetical protein
MTLNGAIMTLNGAFMTLNGAFTTLNGAFMTLNGVFMTLNGAFMPLNGAFMPLNGALMPIQDRQRASWPARGCDAHRLGARFVPANLPILSRSAARPTREEARPYGPALAGGPLDGGSERREPLSGRLRASIGPGRADDGSLRRSAGDLHVDLGLLPTGPGLTRSLDERRRVLGEHGARARRGDLVEELRDPKLGHDGFGLHVRRAGRALGALESWPDEVAGSSGRELVRWMGEAARATYEVAWCSQR